MKIAAAAAFALMMMASAAQADEPAYMTDAQLTSYIAGRLAPLLATTGHDVAETCDASGCSVVVQ